MRPRCLLSVDLEEWSDAQLAGIPAEARDRLPRSLEEAVDRLLALLEHRGARATFFVLGRVARRYPSLVRQIAESHEIATHGDSHEDLPRLDPERLAREIRGSRALLEEQSGRKVVGYRSPNWSMGGCVEWALPVLEEEGIQYDSSLLPGRGFAFLPGSGRIPAHPFRLGPRLWEFPPTVLQGPGFSIPAGGAFLRALPEFAVLAILRHLGDEGGIPHLYLHPWEFDAPGVADVGPLRRAALFAGCRRVPLKVSRILARYRGTAIEEAFGELTRAESAPSSVMGATA